MSNKRVVRNVTMGAALASGVVPLAGAVFTPAEAGPSGDSAAALCKSTFGDHGPGGSVVGEGPPGDKMTVTVGWEPRDWPEGLREVVTCVGLDGNLLQALTRVASQPPNAGNLTVDLMLPQGAPGTLVCQQSILVGKRSTEGRTRTTDAVCFKLRAAEDMVALPDGGEGATPPAGPVAVGTQPPVTPPSAGEAPKAPAPAPAPELAAPKTPMTPPARAAFEAARGAARSPAAWRSGVRAPRAKAPATIAAPVAAPAPAPASAPAPVAAPVPATRVGQAANELARTPSGPSLSGGVARDGASRSAGAAWTTAAPAKARAGAPVAGKPVNGAAAADKAVNGRATGGKPANGTAAAAAAAAQPGAAQADEARASLPRTGLGDRIPLAGAGGLLAIGGAAIILGEPRRRARKA
ncbi:MAG TPA: hypothetical protein VEG38_16540 [Acidimicrobiia bacterium]|nr:hypothetical protein [Acidimicrobiia bacterium]